MACTLTDSDLANELKPLAEPSMTKLGISFGILATVFCLQANAQTIRSTLRSLIECIDTALKGHWDLPSS